MKKILLTGGLGFVGSNIVNKLWDKYDIAIVDDLSFGDKRNDKGYSEYHHLGSEFKHLGFEDLRECFLHDFDILIHCATVNINYAINYPIETFKINALKTIELFQRFKGKIIYTSTSSIYGQANELPTKEHSDELVFNAYDQSKLIAEKFLQQRGNFTTLRLSNVYGENQRPDNPYSGVIGKFIYNILRDYRVDIYGDGRSTRDYTYVGDVVDAIEMCIEQDAKNKEYNISGGNEISIILLSKKLALMMDKPLAIKTIPKRKIDKITRRFLDVTLAKDELGWTPSVSFNNGLDRTIKWMKKEYEI
jgi:nucleoside-diphosphate-sugar epimerase